MTRKKGRENRDGKEGGRYNEEGKRKKRGGRKRDGVSGGRDEVKNEIQLRKKCKEKKKRN